MSRVIHFEIRASNPEALIDFKDPDGNILGPLEPDPAAS